MVHLASEGASDDICASGLRQDLFRWQGAARAPRRMLYFVTAAGNLMVASIRESAGSITVEGVHQLFRSPFLTGRIHTVFDVGPKDGQRFIGSAAPDASTLPLNVIKNWTAELKKK
ncbi:MAG: hypothetical protein DMG34_10405 [Acidobacteria bacterium]|nr:MAG: hypothetical protein DMG34_10405 [Acidobacteriota bacterium]